MPAETRKRIGHTCEAMATVIPNLVTAGPPASHTMRSRACPRRCCRLTSQEFDQEAVKNKTGNNVGLRSIWFNGKRTDKASGVVLEHCKPQRMKVVATDFSRISNDSA